MKRHTAAIAVILCLAPAWLFAQSTRLTITVASADIHRGPSTGSPVVGHVPRGAVLEVSRELGSWVRIFWPGARDGVGYVHVSSGSIERAAALNPNGPTSFSSSSSSMGSTPSVETTAALRTPQIGVGAQRPHVPGTYVTPPTHIVGLGGRISGSTLGLGVTGRGWSRNRFGVQFDLSRYALTSATTAGRVTSVQVAPSVLYSMPDRVSDYLWLRPYIGAGANFLRSSQTGFGSATKIGPQVFGGGELTFSGMPRFAVSADVGYRWSQEPFVGFDFGGMSFSLAGHWYVR